MYSTSNVSPSSESPSTYDPRGLLLQLSREKTSHSPLLMTDEASQLQSDVREPHPVCPPKYPKEQALVMLLMSQLQPSPITHLLLLLFKIYYFSNLLVLLFSVAGVVAVLPKVVLLPRCNAHLMSVVPKSMLFAVLWSRWCR